MTIYSGLIGGFNKMRPTTIPLNPTTYSLKESHGYSFSAELGFNVRGVKPSFGFEYVQRQEQYNITLSNMLDSTLTGSYWTWDSIAMDSSLINTYSYSTSDQSESIRMRSEAFTIPLYIGLERNLARNFIVGLSAGVNLSYLKTTLLENSGAPILPEQKKFGMSVLLRPYVRYSFGNYAVGIYGRAGYNFITGTVWDTNKRSRLETGVGLSLSYRF